MFNSNRKPSKSISWLTGQALCLYTSNDLEFEQMAYSNPASRKAPMYQRGQRAGSPILSLFSLSASS